jgi:thioredoxin reductase (NADPH)
MEKQNLVIIGSGPAAYTAAIYAARANLSPVLFEGFESGPAGGQLMSTTVVENFPGFPDGILGPELMEKMRAQAKRFGTNILTQDVVSVDLTKRPFFIKASETQMLANAIIIATGASAKRLDVTGTHDGEFWQKGVTACAVCDGAAPIFRNKILYVIGGGDTAVEEAIFLTKYASRVFLVHRRDTLRASRIMIERAIKNPKIEILYNRTLEKVAGDQVVRKVVLKDVLSGQTEEREAAGVFFAIGHQPSTGFLQGQIKLNPAQYIVTKNGTPETSKAGVFAAGDVMDPVDRQAITAAGRGCSAALAAERWLSKRGYIK